jgi:Endonuclease/Exonuclease/phosphatase family
MRRSSNIFLTAVLVIAFVGVQGAGANGFAAQPVDDHPASLRFATFNASLNRGTNGAFLAAVTTTTDPQIKGVAEIIQRAAPDVLLVNEFDFDAQHIALDRFNDNYLAISQHGARPISYPYRFTAPSNTGIPSGFDFDNDGSVGGGNDAFGFGAFPGQFGMAVYSQYPIDETNVRTFQHFLWKDMPGALPPDDASTPAPADWYSSDELAVFRLSSKSHWDVPIAIGSKVVHFLVSHPTPPVFDGPEDRNGLRNHDEIRFWADYLDPSRSSYLYDDTGGYGGLANGGLFVIAGDMNADPLDGDSVANAVQQLLEHRRIDARTTPTSPGGPEQSTLQGGANLVHLGDPAFDTADFADTTPGNLRADYVLARRGMPSVRAGVYWPLMSDPAFAPVGVFPFPSSDHRLVWLDLDASRL